MKQEVRRGTPGSGRTHEAMLRQARTRQVTGGPVSRYDTTEKPRLGQPRIDGTKSTHRLVAFTR